MPKIELADFKGIKLERLVAEVTDAQINEALDKILEGLGVDPKTIAMINLDMIGRMKEKALIIGGVGTAQEWRSLIDTGNAVEGMTGKIQRLVDGMRHRKRVGQRDFRQVNGVGAARRHVLDESPVALTS